MEHERDTLIPPHRAANNLWYVGCAAAFLLPPASKVPLGVECTPTECAYTSYSCLTVSDDGTDVRLIGPRIGSPFTSAIPCDQREGWVP
jgi:hypothetical protein